MTTFESTKVSLKDVITGIQSGKIQLPDFQRDWVWDDEHVRSLLVSVARSFPVGAVMLLETGGETRFKTRPVQGVTLIADVRPEKLILDGQQRLTSLTQVLGSASSVETFDAKKVRVQRYYYIDIRKAVATSGDLDDAFVSLDETRQLRSQFGRKVDLDLSTRQLECQEMHFPCNQIISSDEWETALYKFAPHEFPLFMMFREKVLNAFRQYSVPVIELKKETSKEAVCLVFEKVNTGGVALTVFELVTASYAAEEFNLREDLLGNEKNRALGRLRRLQQQKILSALEPSDFLQVVTLLHTHEKRTADIEAGKTGNQLSAISGKRSAVLALPLAAYKEWGERAAQGFELAAQFMRKECFFDLRDIPYRTQLIPLAALLALLGNRWLEHKNFDKLSQWYWCGVLGELYGGAVDTRISNDVEQVFLWLQGGQDEPNTVADASFQPSRLDTLRTRTSAAYKGLHVLVQRDGSRDFFWKDRVQNLDVEDVAIDIHHIFPKDWCEKRTPKIDPRVYNSIVNKTAISYKANRMIGGSAPSKYLVKLEQHDSVGLTSAGMDEILASHDIASDLLRADAFERFYEARKTALLVRIEKAMGKAPLAAQVATPAEMAADGLGDD